MVFAVGIDSGGAVVVVVDEDKNTDDGDDDGFKDDVFESFDMVRGWDTKKASIDIN
jgi:hypothetical protein